MSRPRFGVKERLVANIIDAASRATHSPDLTLSSFDVEVGKQCHRCTAEGLIYAYHGFLLGPSSFLTITACLT